MRKYCGFVRRVESEEMSSEMGGVLVAGATSRFSGDYTPHCKNVIIFFSFLLALPGLFWRVPDVAQLSKVTVKGGDHPSAKACGVVWGLCVKREKRTFPFRSPRSQPGFSFHGTTSRLRNNVFSSIVPPSPIQGIIPEITFNDAYLCPYLWRITHL